MLATPLISPKAKQPHFFRRDKSPKRIKLANTQGGPSAYTANRPKEGLSEPTRQDQGFSYITPFFLKTQTFLLMLSATVDIRWPSF